MNRKASSLAAAMAITLATASCAYDGQSMDNPLTRRFTWFSFVAGDDIRTGCAAGAPDRYRLVYNGFWHDQVRIYEWGTPEAPADLRQRVLEGMAVRVFSTNDWTAPWRGAVAATPLDRKQRDGLAAALAASGLFAPPPVGLRLPSDGYYWTAVACAGGKFVFNAWLYPDDGFERLTFPRALMALDRTGVALEDPNPAHRLMHYSQSELDSERWTIEVEPDGLSTSGSF